MTEAGDDPIAAFYERHPYPPPVDDLESLAVRARDRRVQRVAHHRIWPGRDPQTVRSVLVAGCGTSQAARHALRRPDASVMGIDVSATAVEHTRRLAEHHGLTNLEARQLSIEDVGQLGECFDHIVCTGVLHHLADPALGLSRLRSVLAPQGAVTLMVYARYGRYGVHLLQDYCRRLGLTTSRRDVADLVATLRELPSGHPVERLLRGSRDFLDDDALADALLNPRDRAYTVAEVLELLAGAGLRFGRWEQQAPYRPDCGSIAETPHAARIAALPPAEQWSAVELLRGTLTRHTVIAHRDDDEASGQLDFSSPEAKRWVPLRSPTAVVVAERLPPGAAAALLDRTHPAADLVLFVDRRRLRAFQEIDGERTIGALGKDALSFVERLWRHDLVVIDASGGGARPT